VAEKALVEDEVNALLQRRVVELEAANTQMRSDLDHSGETVAVLQSNRCSLSSRKKMTSANA
jgi:hypothetical protein